MTKTTIDDISAAFPSEGVCIAYLEKILWNGIPVSPFVSNSKVYYCKNNRYKCRESGLYFNVKTNTIFHKSKISLTNWFAAIWLLSNSEVNITSVQLADELGITQKSAWHMMRRIKNHFEIPPSKHKPSEYKAAIVNDSELIIEQNTLKMSDWLKMLKK